MVPQKKCKYVPKRMCHTRIISSKSSKSDEIMLSISPIESPRQIEIAENGNRVARANAMDIPKLREDSGLPDHLKNFKEFHSLPPPSSRKFIVLNRRLRRSTR